MKSTIRATGDAADALFRAMTNPKKYVLWRPEYGFIEYDGQVFGYTQNVSAATEATENDWRAVLKDFSIPESEVNFLNVSIHIP